VLRAILIYLSQAAWARHIVTRWRFARRAAARFIAGDTLEEAIEVIRNLNSIGLFATLDHLGEHTSTLEDATRAANSYITVLKRIHESGVKSNISVKLTQLGLNLGSDACLQNMTRIVTSASEIGVLVRIDIEDASTVDRNLEVLDKLHETGHTNVGQAIQSYLYRSEEDLKTLLDKGVHIRLCKGAYKEPPNIAFPRKADVDQNYDLLTQQIIDSALSDGAAPASLDGKVPPVTAIATHDEKRIIFACDYATRTGFPKESLEFQMLLGIRPDLQKQLAEEGYPVRIYVPFGTEWYPYFVRRLAERPANLWFFISNFFRGR
jgi:proline dehydrogenase